MKRNLWVLITALTVLLTAVILTRAGRLGLTRSLHACPRRVEVRGHAQAGDPMMSIAALRWLRGQPNHWRACLLQQ